MLARPPSDTFTCRLATTPEDVAAVQRLRYDVFATEFGAVGDGIDHHTQRETDQFDVVADHLLLIDPSRANGSQIIGTYRLMRTVHAAQGGGFYSAAEYDLAPLMALDANILELGRSCLHPDYRGGTALLQLWQGVGRYVADHDITYLFGVASFHGTDIAAIAEPLSMLHHDHLAPPELRVSAIGEGATAMDLVETGQLDRRAAMIKLPALIKAYLRLGGVVGDGAFVDHGFNTTDVCLILNAAKMSDRQRALYGGGAV